MQARPPGPMASPMAPVRNLCKGEVLLTQGEPGGSAFLILSGELELTVSTPHRTTTVARLGEGELIGEVGLFDPEAERSATATAFTDRVRVREIGPEALEAELAAASPELRALVEAMMRRLREVYAKVAKLAY